MSTMTSASGAEGPVLVSVDVSGAAIGEHWRILLDLEARR
jgi:hypothetical protein